MLKDSSDGHRDRPCRSEGAQRSHSEIRRSPPIRRVSTIRSFMVAVGARSISLRCRPKDVHVAFTMKSTGPGH